MTTDTPLYHNSRNEFERVAKELGFDDGRAFVLDYLARGETRASVSQRTGIPYKTLRHREEMYVECHRTYRIRETGQELAAAR